FNLDYNSIDLMFGGRAGKDKNIFKYSLYGSSTVRGETDVYNDLAPYRISNQYLPFGQNSDLALRNPSFIPSDSDTLLPRLGLLPHESRLFGVNLTFRGVNLNYQRMGRADHAALGRSPLAVSYSNPSNRLSERHDIFSLGFKRQRKRHLSHTNIAIQRYYIGNNSTVSHVFGQTAAAEFWLRKASSSNIRATLDSVIQKYSGREKFAAASGFDVRLESRLEMKLSRHIHFDLGANGYFGGGSGVYEYYDIPPELDVFNVLANSDIVEIDQTGTAVGEVNFFAQSKWQSRRVYAIFGGSFNVNPSRPVLLPRLGIWFRADSNWTFRANFSGGINHSNVAKDNATLLFDAGYSRFVLNGALSYDGFTTERTYGGEVAIRFKDKDANFPTQYELIGFFQEGYDLLRPGIFRAKIDTFNPRYSTYGYAPANGLSSRMWGIQGLFKSGSLSVDVNKSSVKAKTTFFIQYARGMERWGYNLRPEIDEILNQPKWHTQFRTFIDLGKNIEIMVASNRQTSVLSKSVMYRDFFNLSDRQERYPTFRSWDMVVRFFVNNHFFTYFQLQNMFNRTVSGLDATGTGEDISRPVQPGRSWRFGVNYNMN
ncbi:MAG: TonB-dependent receptor, partial [Saprospiraceae bacterium]|nr:TonB-dependent receptor [Saprospiraceae bacterium]